MLKERDEHVVYVLRVLLIRVCVSWAESIFYNFFFFRIFVSVFSYSFHLLKIGCGNENEGSFFPKFLKCSDFPSTNIFPCMNKQLTRSHIFSPTIPSTFSTFVNEVISRWNLSVEDSLPSSPSSHSLHTHLSSFPRPSVSMRLYSLPLLPSLPSSSIPAFESRINSTNACDTSSQLFHPFLL